MRPANGLTPPAYLKDPDKIKAWLGETTQLLAFIAHYVDTNGRVPPFRKIAEHFGRKPGTPLVNLCTISRRLDYLETAGYIEREEGSRKWTYTGKDWYA